jgi:hypothetical protein
MSNEAITKPTIETVLERINALGERVDAGFAAVEERLERMDIRLDRAESIALSTRADVQELRSDFRKFSKQQNSPA